MCRAYDVSPFTDGQHYSRASLDGSNNDRWSAFNDSLNSTGEPARHLRDEPHRQTVLTKLEPAQGIGAHRLHEQCLGVDRILTRLVARERKVFRADADHYVLSGGG